MSYSRRPGSRVNALVATTSRKFTKTELQILRYIQRRDGKSCTKAQIAQALGRNEKTIDRLISGLRHDGMIVSEARFDEHGGQLANAYRLVSEEEVA